MPTRRAIAFRTSVEKLLRQLTTLRPEVRRTAEALKSIVDKELSNSEKKEMHDKFLKTESCVLGFINELGEAFDLCPPEFKHIWESIEGLGLLRGGIINSRVHYGWQKTDKDLEKVEFWLTDIIEIAEDRTEGHSKEESPKALEEVQKHLADPYGPRQSMQFSPSLLDSRNEPLVNINSRAHLTPTGDSEVEKPNLGTTQSRTNPKKRKPQEDVEVRRGIVIGVSNAHPESKRQLDKLTCQQLDDSRFDIPGRWTIYGVQTWEEALKNPQLRPLVHKMFSSDRKNIKLTMSAH